MQIGISLPWTVAVDASFLVTQVGNICPTDLV